jgi:hypothetical protein
MKVQTIVLGVMVIAACGKKAEQPEPAAKPVESAPAAKPSEPATTQPAKPAEPAPVKVDTKPSQPSAAGDAGDKDKALVLGAASDATRIEWSAPTGDKVTVAVTKHLVGNVFAVDLVVAGKVVDTVKTGAEKPDANGFTHYEPKAYVATIGEGVLFVAGTTKITGKPDDSYDARVLTWSDATKTLAVARKIQFEVAYDPAMDKDTN